MIISIIAFFIIFGVIVVSHEFGHFAIARRNGIRVLEFDIGFGPELYRKEGKETDLSIRLLPIGGACLFDGLDGVSQEKGELDEHAFPNAKPGARFATILAGPMANFILGFLLATILVAFSGVTLPTVQSVMDDSAAQEAGLEAGDRITRINGESIHLYEEVSLISQLSYGHQLTITYSRDGQKNTVTLTPRYDEESGRYLIGIQGGEYHKCNALEVFQYGFYQGVYWVKVTWKSLGLIFTGHFSKDDVSGPVGIVKAVDDTRTAASPYGASAVILSLLNLTTLLTINLGIVNLLPLPALDGGRLLFVIIEMLRGKPVPPEKEGMVHLAGVMVLLFIMILVMFNDISRFFR